MIEAVHKRTGDIVKVWCLDDYFGRHKYGYIIRGDDKNALTESEFYKVYKRKEPENAKA
jgi:hypothetical protein